MVEFVVMVEVGVEVGVEFVVMVVVMVEVGVRRSQPMRHDSAPRNQRFTQERGSLMPRITDSASDPHDFCRSCMPTEADAMEEFNDVEKFGFGPDGRGNCFDYAESEHPDYGEFPGMYECEGCGDELGERDNDLPAQRRPA